jgi:hypothetical protein
MHRTIPHRQLPQKYATKHKTPRDAPPATSHQQLATSNRFDMMPLRIVHTRIVQADDALRPIPRVIAA